MATKAQIDEMLAGCTGEMAYRLFLEREPLLGDAFEMGRQMIAMGHSADEIVDRILNDLSPDNRQYAADNPHVRILLVRATEYAATMLDAKLHTAPLN
ncbi:MAG TPA: hypothetical protein VHO25_04505 [Polyangiaceae bacterium]|nr:hypothetical protein [Polyangiaceae bacterium]